MRRPTGTTGSEMVQSAAENYGDKYTEEGKWVIGEWYKAMSALYESQKRAGTSMHFDKEFSNIKEGAPSWMRDDLQDNAWRLYTDGSWEIGDVTTDEGLREALRTIEASGDSGLVGTHDYRSADQRDYLANKAYVRYLNAKLESFGLADVKNAFNTQYKIFLTLGRSKDGAKQAVATLNFALILLDACWKHNLIEGLLAFTVMGGHLTFAMDLRGSVLTMQQPSAGEPLLRAHGLALVATVAFLAYLVDLLAREAGDRAKAERRSWWTCASTGARPTASGRIGPRPCASARKRCGRSSPWRATRRRRSNSAFGRREPPRGRHGRCS